MGNPIVTTGVQSPYRAVRIAAMGLLFLACILRAWRLFARLVCKVSACAPYYLSVMIGVTSDISINPMGFK